MKMDIFDKSAVVDGTVLEVMQPWDDQKTLLAGINHYGYAAAKSAHARSILAYTQLTAILFCSSYTK